MRKPPNLGMMIILCVITVIGGVAAQGAPRPKSRLAGPWSGAIQIPDAPLRITVRFVAKDEAFTGTIDIPQQAAKDLPLKEISLREDQVRFKIAGVAGEPSFNGAVQGDVIAGTFVQNGQSFAFEIKRGEPKRIRRPQDPKPPFTYMSEEVSIPNIGVTLSGTLLKPPHVEKPPVVVFITGSGPQNRDEELFDHRPFAVLADFLARRKIASLRVDDRGVGKSIGPRATSMRDVASDAAACIEYLKGRFEFGPIGLIGHSEGAAVAASLAAKRDDIAFVILLAGPAIDGKTLMVEQNRLIFKAKGFSDEAADNVADKAETLFRAIIANSPDDYIAEKTKALINAQTMGKAPASAMESEMTSQVAAMRDPWLREFLQHNPQEDLRKLKIPVLALWGEKDVQVAAEQNRQAAEAALNPFQNKLATLKVIPGANHLFQTCKTGGLDEYALIDETISPEALKIIEDWLPRATVPVKKQ